MGAQRQETRKNAAHMRQSCQAMRQGVCGTHASRNQVAWVSTAKDEAEAEINQYIGRLQIQ